MLKAAVNFIKQVFNKEIKKDEAVNTNDLGVAEETKLVSLPEARKATYEEYEESLQGIVEAAEAYEASLNDEEKQLYEERKEMFICKCGLDTARGDIFYSAAVWNRIKANDGVYFEDIAANRKLKNNKYLIIANRTKSRRIRKKNLKKYSQDPTYVIDLLINRNEE